MMKRRYFDHIDLRVKDIERAHKFYQQVLPAIGFTEPGDTGPEWYNCYARGEGKTEFFGYTVDPDHVPNGTRISFWAESREEVDRVAEVVRAAGGKVLEGPEVCVEYTPNYYAFFWEDPDGNKLEICYREAPAS